MSNIGLAGRGRPLADVCCKVIPHPCSIRNRLAVLLWKARETFNIVKLKSEKRRGVEDIEHGLNLDPGQQ